MRDKSGRDAERLPVGAAPIEMSEKDLSKELRRLEKLMLDHASNLEFEQAARVRDQLAALKARTFGASGESAPAAA